MEVGRELVCDTGGLLPGGFWAAVAVWLERPQVANKRLCGARLEARRSATLPRASAGPGQEWGAAFCGLPEGPGPGRGFVEEHLGPRPELEPREGTACHRHEETQDQRLQEEQSEAATAPLLAERPGQLRGAGDEGHPAADLDSFWDRFSQSLVSSHPEMLLFLTCPRAGSQSEAPHELDLVLRTIIPKTSPHYSVTAPMREIVVQDVLNGTVTFLPLEEDEEENLKVKMSNVYQIQLSRGEAEWFISVLIFCPEKWHADGIVYPRVTWLGEELLGKLARWCVAHRKSEFRSTLSLISIVRYSTLYQELKEKYRAVVKVWPEVTNPEKFVYEDVAIATYLLILWEEERAQRGMSARQSFLDLGCGNGLLVHILCSEGHPGRGIDVRRRKIWDMYGPHTLLEEVAITPSDQTLFPDVDWLLGNHSDELTPWIPVIAARSSYHCRFFVLPCCFFDFVGKYRRRQSRKTQYREYLDFIWEVGQACGFHVEEDCLRIPSTKRVCLIGKRRTYLPDAEISMDEQRTQYIRSRQGLSRRDPLCSAPQAAACSANHLDSNRASDTGAHCNFPVPVPEGGSEVQAGGLWLLEFHPREKAERVRNCATLPRDFIDQVVLRVANLLLGAKKSNTGSPEQVIWNRGESLSLVEVARQLDRATLQRLKKECGGLKTLLRNNHQVFEVLDGRVHIRDWQRELQRLKHSETFKTRACWFFTHHPDGCTLTSASCPFAHGPQELRPPQPPRRKRQCP